MKREKNELQAAKKWAWVEGAWRHCLDIGRAGTETVNTTRVIGGTDS